MKLLLFFCTLTLSYLQAQSTLISGKVIIDGEETIDLGGIEITNLSTNAKTKTNNLGIFSVKVSLNDELLFKSEGLEERLLKISSTILQKGFASVHLNPEVIELTEARINTLNKYWQKNIKLKYDYVDSLYINLGIDPNLRFKKIHLNVRSMGLNISKKQAKQNLKYFKKIDALEKVEEYFTKYYFINNLKIPENKISEFLLFCDNIYNLEEKIKGNDFELINEILKKETFTYLSKINAKTLNDE